MIKEFEAAVAFASWQNVKKRQRERFLRKQSIVFPLRSLRGNNKLKSTWKIGTYLEVYHGSN